MNNEVPKELQHGNHAEINTWRRNASLKMTLKYRPDLLKKALLSEKDRIYLNEIRNTSIGEKYPHCSCSLPCLTKK